RDRCREAPRALSQGVRQDRRRSPDHLSLPPAADPGDDRQAHRLWLPHRRADPAAGGEVRAVRVFTASCSQAGNCTVTMPSAPKSATTVAPGLAKSMPVIEPEVTTAPARRPPCTRAA